MNNNPENFGRINEQEVSFFINLTIIGLIIWAIYAIYNLVIEKIIILNNIFHENIKNLYKYLDYFFNLF